MQRTPPPQQENPILLFSKADLENECEKFGLSTHGTAVQLRERLLQRESAELNPHSSPGPVLTGSEFVNTSVIDYKVEPRASRKTELGATSVHWKPSASPYHVSPPVSSGHDPMTLLMTFLMKQEENRSLDERRREEQRTEDARRKEEQRLEDFRRREEDETRRREDFERILMTQREFFTSIAPHNSEDSSRSSVSDFQSVKRAVDRLENESIDAVRTLNGELENNASKHALKGSLSRLGKIDSRLSKILDDKIDLLDGDEKKDTLIQRIYDIGKQIKGASDIGENRIEVIEKRERQESRAGALPGGFKIPSFDGNVLHFRKWWEEFRSLVHENQDVSKFYKMRYLIQALTGAAAAVLGGKDGLEAEYDECIATVQKKFGREHIVVRQIVQSIMTASTPANDATQFGNFIEEMNNRVAALETHEATRDMVVVPMIESHLPTGVRMNWERHVHGITEDDRTPSTDDLCKFCHKELDAMISKAAIKGEGKSSKNENKSKWENRSNDRLTSAQSLLTLETREKEDFNQDPKQGITCSYCGASHVVTACQKFLDLNKLERRQHVGDNKLCFRCLVVAFSPQQHHCRKKKCSECGYRHHELISCPPELKTEETAKSLIAAASESKSTFHAKRKIIVSNEEKVVSPTVLARARSGDRDMEVRLALDTMSEKTFVSQRVAETLKLIPHATKHIMVQGFGGHETKTKVSVAEMKLVPLTTNEPSIAFEAYIKSGPLGAPLHPVNIQIEDHPHLKGIRLADPNVSAGAEIDVLVGSALLSEIMLSGIIRPRGGESRLTAFETVFGYALLGPITGRSNPSASCLFVHAPSITDNCDNDHTKTRVSHCDIEKFWSLDSIGITDNCVKMTADEERAVALFEAETTFNGVRYEIPLPFRQDAPMLSNNYKTAKKLLESTERRLEKNPEMKERYIRAMRELVDLQFSRQLTEREVDRFESDGECYYIPHHGVIKESSVSTKFRLVFNASHPDRNGNSLNDCLLPGPALQPDLGGVLLRFRKHRIALSGDIEKMFPQTKILPQYYKYQLFLWRDCDASCEPTKMVMTSLMFGVNYSPCGAISCTHRHAGREDMKRRYPRLCEELVQSLYVDDLHIGGDSVTEVVNLYRDAVAFFESGGWRMTKFVSNSEVVMDVIPSCDRHPHSVIAFDRADDVITPTALGLRWNPASDTFFVNVSSKLVNIPQVPSKRIVLSTFSSIYDVFGFLAGYTIIPKIQMQRIWRLKIDWDEALPDAEAIEFSKWAEELEDISSIIVPRHLFRGSAKQKVQIHGFCDASEKAYGAMVYLVYHNDSGKKESILVMAKARVAPLKSQTIARLELMGAVILARLTNYVIEQLQLDVECTHLWSDSEIVLAWINKPSSTWKIFVRNRVEEIHSLFDANVWGHCPGKENPADVLSRGVTLRELKTSDLYWNGPPWIVATQTDWPTKRFRFDGNSANDIAGEMERAPCALIVSQKEIELPPNVVMRCSSYRKARRLLAWMLRYLDMKAKRVISAQSQSTIAKERPSELTAKELERAEFGLLRDLQRRHFSMEITLLKIAKRLPEKSPLLDYDPFIDEETGLLRVGGRLRHSNLPEMSKHPIILPDHDLLTERVVEDHHISSQHAAAETTLSLLRQRYYVVHARQVVKRVIHKCHICRRYRTKPVVQKMGDLPPHRVVPAPAFSDVGLDYTGALLIRDGDNAVKKGYILVFTCPHSRMIHFELCLDMTTDEFLQALRRFMNRRGWCQTIESDNQLTFKKAKKLLERTFAGSLFEKLDSVKIKRFMAENGITWKFITERSPFRGAYWERLNRSLKEPLRKILGNALLRYTELYTILTDIEAALNQRPLAYHGSSPLDPTPITPSQLTIGRNLRELPAIRGRGNVTVGKRFRYLQRLLQSFWKRWSSEYLPKLQQRGKWKHEEPPIKVGDVVLVTEENTSRPSWPLGRVIDVFSGRDGLVRTAQVKTQKGIIFRPVQRLHVLESMDLNPDRQNDCVPEDMADVSVKRESVPTNSKVSQGEENVVKRTSRGRVIRKPNLFKPV